MLLGPAGALLLALAASDPLCAETKPSVAAPTPAQPASPVTVPQAPASLPAATSNRPAAGNPGTPTDTTARPAPPRTRMAIPNFWDPKRRPERPAGDVGTIRFLTSGDFPPFNFLDSGGRLIGFNVDLARAICDVLSAACTIQMRPFEDLVTAIGERRGDAIIAGLVIGPQLRAKLDASDVYLTTPGRFVAQKNSTLTPTPEGLDLRWISVVSGTAHEAFVLDNFPRSRVVAYPNETAARDALRDGTVDVHFGDAVGLSFWILGQSSKGCCAFRGSPYLETSYFGDGFRIAIAKNNRRVKLAIDYALHQLHENGTIAELYFRYFPLGFY